MSYRYCHVCIFCLCRLRAANKAQGDGTKRTRHRDRAVRAIPAPDANAELQANIDVCLSSIFKNSLHLMDNWICIFFFHRF